MLLELGLRLDEAAGGGDGHGAAEAAPVPVGVLGILSGPAQLEHGALGEQPLDLDVEPGDVLVVDRGADVGAVIGERGADLLGGGDHDRSALVDQVEERAEAVRGQELGERPPSSSPSSVASASASSARIRWSGSISAAGSSSIRSASASERWVKVEK